MKNMLLKKTLSKKIYKVYAQTWNTVLLLYVQIDYNYKKSIIIIFLSN